jgi:hypothetical protein
MMKKSRKSLDEMLCDVKVLDFMDSISLYCCLYCGCGVGSADDIWNRAPVVVPFSKKVRCLVCRDCYTPFMEYLRERVRDWELNKDE